MMRTPRAWRMSSVLSVGLATFLMSGCLHTPLRRAHEGSQIDAAWYWKWNEWYLKRSVLQLDIVPVYAPPITEAAPHSLDPQLIDVYLVNFLEVPVAVPRWLPGHESRFLGTRVLDFYVKRDGEMIHTPKPYGLRHLSSAAHPIASDGAEGRSAERVVPAGRSYSIGIYKLPLSKGHAYEVWCTLAIALGDAPRHGETQTDEALYLRSRVLAFSVPADGVLPDQRLNEP